MTRLSLIGALAALLSTGYASAAPPSGTQGPATEPPRFVVIVPRTSGVQAPQVREKMESALIENGAIIVPDADKKKAERQYSLPTDQAPDATGARQLAIALNLDGIVELKVNRASPVAGNDSKYVAELRVLGPDGQSRVDTEVPVASRQLTTKDLSNLADIAVDAVKTPAVAPAPPKVSDSTGAPAVVAPATVPPSPNEQQKKSSPQPSLFFEAAPNLTWRSVAVNGAPPVQSLDFGTGKPYAGATLGVEANPFTGSWSQYLGFDLQYSFSVLGVSAPIPGTNISQRETATENRLIADVVGHTPGGVFGGDLSLRVGWAYEGFIVNPVGSLVSSQHNSLRFFLGYQRELFKRVAIDFGGGYRPFAIPGGGLTSAFGDREQSYGVEAHAGLSGPLDFLVHNLRWMAAYDFLRYSDLFSGSGGTTSNIENYNRILLGFTFQAPVRF